MNLVAQGIDSGEFVPQIPSVSAAALVGVIAESLVGPLSWTATDKTEMRADDLIAAIQAFCLRALSATAPVWLRVYDASKTKLFEKEMAVGERYTVPPNANNPMILTGRPESLKVTVGGSEVAPLGTAERSIKDVGISAAALAARGCRY